MISHPTIPESIVIHLGAPESNAENVTESFQNYIKNVASSEIYPTWNEEAIKANILAQISVALNRVYTEYYRSRGRNFDITSSPAYDQTYIYKRNIYDNISAIVDEIFNSYIRRENYIEPLFATFCDGVEVSCNGLEQWGSLELANQGLNAFEILKRYYGNDIEIVTNVPVDNIPESAPSADISLGDTGIEVERIQTKLNRISQNFPGIPKIPEVDGFFSEATEAAVKKFQEVFNLTVDGIVGKATWYRIQQVYNAVKKLSEVNSEGLKLDDISTQFTETFEEGASSPGVIALQYFLQYISLFLPNVTSPAVDGVFGPLTKESVISFQKAYGLTETGVVNRAVWEAIQNTYYDYLESVAYEFKSGTALPFPGRILREGLEGADVRALQEYLNFISNSYTSIPKVTVDGVFGPGTAAAVREYKRLFALTGNPERVSVETWNSIVNLYDDLYYGTNVREGQYPGYEINRNT